MKKDKNKYDNVLGVLPFHDISDENVLLICSGLPEKTYNLKEKCKDTECHVDLNQPSYNVSLSDFDQDIDPSLHHYNNNTECHYYMEDNFNNFYECQ